MWLKWRGQGQVRSALVGVLRGLQSLTRGLDFISKTAGTI